MNTQVMTRKPKAADRLTDLDDAAKAIIFRTPTSRFVFPDFSTYGAWLVDRLRPMWPHVTERSIIGWLRGCSESKEFHFLKTDHAVGMAEVSYHPLTAIPQIEETFVIVDNVTREKSLYEACAIYCGFKRWAKTLGADEIVVGRCSDVPLELIERAIGKIAKREILM